MSAHDQDPTLITHEGMRHIGCPIPDVTGDRGSDAFEQAVRYYRGDDENEQLVTDLAAELRTKIDDTLPTDMRMDSRGWIYRDGRASDQEDSQNGESGEALTVEDIPTLDVETFLKETVEVLFDGSGNRYLDADDPDYEGHHEDENED